MAYDEGLAQRIREQLANEPMIHEKKMFGGLAFMVAGNMICGVKDGLMARVGAEAYEQALSLPGASPFVMTGKPMKGFVDVSLEALESDEALAEWVQRCLDFALSLPPK